MKSVAIPPFLSLLMIAGVAQANNPACIDECAKAFASKNYSVALTECTAAAEYGHVPAQRFVGTMYAAGWGTQKDYNKSVYWLRKAADQGDASAQKYLSKLEGKPYQPPVVQVTQPSPNVSIGVSNIQNAGQMPPVVVNDRNEMLPPQDTVSGLANRLPAWLSSDAEKAQFVSTVDRLNGLLDKLNNVGSGSEKEALLASAREVFQKYLKSFSSEFWQRKALEDGVLAISVNNRANVLAALNGCGTATQSDVVAFFSGSKTTCDNELDQQRYTELIKHQDPVVMYEGAKKYENNGEEDRARTVYKEIVTRFPKHRIAKDASEKIKPMVAFEAPVNELKYLADAGSLRAQFLLGCMYGSGLGVSQDKPLANRLLTESENAQKRIWAKNSEVAKGSDGKFRQVNEGDWMNKDDARFGLGFWTFRPSNSMSYAVCKGDAKPQSFHVDEFVKLMRYVFINADKYGRGDLLRTEYIKWTRVAANAGDNEAKRDVAVIDFNALVASLKCDDAAKYKDNTSYSIPNAGKKISACYADLKEQIIVSSDNPNVMYSEAAKYVNSKQNDRAKRVYEAIMARFPKHNMAAKAADGLVALKNAERIEEAAGYARQRAEAVEARAADAERRADDANFRANQAEIYGGRY